MQAGIGGVRHLSRLWSPTPCLCCFRIGRHQLVQTDGEERVPVEVAEVQHFPDFHTIREKLGKSRLPKAAGDALGEGAPAPQPRQERGI